jgi:hypothetical protein
MKGTAYEIRKTKWIERVLIDMSLHSDCDILITAG